MSQWFRVGGERQREVELDAELRDHLEHLTADLRNHGLDEDAARRRARLMFGGLEQVKERCRDVRPRRWLERLTTDIRLVYRSSRRRLTFTFACVVTLALGLGATIAIFTVVNTVLLRPLPMPNANRLVVLEHVAPKLTPLEMGMSDALYVLYANESHTLERVALFENAHVSLTDPGNPQWVPAAQVSASFFDVVQVPPHIGRVFTGDDERPGAPPVVVLGYGLWQRRFGGDPTVVGEGVEIDGRPVEVIGVMPRGFSFPDLDTQLWQVIRLDPEDLSLGNFRARGLARLADGQTPAQVQAELSGMAANLAELLPDQGPAAMLVNAGFTSRVKPARTLIVGDIQATLWMLLGAVGFLFLIACANVTNLLLARAEARHREFALRLALGESRAHVVGTALAESVLLALISGLVAAPLAVGAVGLVVRFGPQELPRLSEIAPDATVVLFGLALSLIAGVLFGILPALKAGAMPVSACLSDGARGSSAGRDRHLMRRVLVVMQLALALTLLVGSGLAARSFQRLAKVDPGFDPTGVLGLRLSLPEGRYQRAERRLQFHRRLVARLAGLPGARAAAAVSALPLDGSIGGSSATIEGRVRQKDEVPATLMQKYVSPGYFDAIGIAFVEGRDFNQLDEDRGTPVVIVSRNVARTYWPDESALGKGIRQSPGPGEGTWFRIVGVVEDVHQQSLHDLPPHLAYYPLAVPTGDDQFHVPSAMSYVVRSDGTDLAAPARAAVHALDPALPISVVEPLEYVVARARARRAFLMVLLGIASALALLLGAIGLYGVISFVVAQRRHEIAIRMAMGAQLTDIRRLVLVEAGWMAVVGTALGLASAVALTRRLQALLFNTSPLDPVVIITVSVLLATICFLASWFPARKAALVDPIATLRAE